jgi:translation initiation factor 3 subunit G
MVQELFSAFGPISRIYIAYDRETGESRGFAFVNFVYRYRRRCWL